MSANNQYCSEFNITLLQLLRTPESSTTSAYARYILDIGTQSDILELYVAIAACLIGYGEVGLWLQKQVQLGEAKVEGNIYKRWMEDYGGEDFLGAVDRGIGMSPSSSLFFTYPFLLMTSSPTFAYSVPLEALIVWSGLIGRKSGKEGSSRTTLTRTIREINIYLARGSKART